MKKHKIEVTGKLCKQMEQAAQKPMVKDAVVNFMTQKMNVEFEEGADHKWQDAGAKELQKVEDDCEIYL